MEKTRKRASIETSLKRSTELKKSKPNDSSLPAFSTIYGGKFSDEDNLRKTDHGNRSNGDTREIKKEVTWGDENYVSKESFGCVREIKEDPSTTFNNAEENRVEPSWFGGQVHAPIKTEKGTQEESKEAKQSQNHPSKSYTCECGKSYSSSSLLHRHQKTHVGNDQMTGGGGGGVGEPEEVKVKSEKSFPCVCGKSYTSISHLHRHQKTCQAGSLTNPEESRLKPYLCACGKGYTCSSHLYRHQKSHLGGTRHQRSHLGGTNESARPHVCDCGKTFSRRFHLNRHQKIHTLQKVQIDEHGGDSVEDTEVETQGMMKPYVCVCGKSYTSSSHLYRHQRTHQDMAFSSSSRARESNLEKPYKCECGKSYTCTSHLYRHQRTHKTQELLVDDLDGDSDVHYEDSEEKPYQCECGKSFILWFSLMVHKRVHCKAQRQSPAGHNGSG